MDQSNSIHHQRRIRGIASILRKLGITEPDQLELNQPLQKSLETATLLELSEAFKLIADLAASSPERRIMKFMGDVTEWSPICGAPSKWSALDNPDLFEAYFIYGDHLLVSTPLESYLVNFLSSSSPKAVLFSVTSLFANKHEGWFFANKVMRKNEVCVREIQPENYKAMNLPEKMIFGRPVNANSFTNARKAASLIPEVFGGPLFHVLVKISTTLILK